MYSTFSRERFRMELINYITTVALSGAGESDYYNGGFKKYIKMINLDRNDHRIVFPAEQPIYAGIDFPVPNIKAEIIALSSLIQPVTCACFINTSLDFLKTAIDLQIEMFSHDNEILLKKIKYYNGLNQPLMISVTEEVAQALLDDPSYECFKALEVVPGFLRLTSPKPGLPVKISEIDFSRISILKINHLTDNSAIKCLEKALMTNKSSSNIRSGLNIVEINDQLPENPFVYKNLTAYQFALTQDFLDNIAGKQSEITDWKYLEKRYVFFNQSLLNLHYRPKYSIDKKTVSFAKWCQKYLAYQFWESINGKKEPWRNILRDNDYFRAISKIIGD